MQSNSPSPVFVDAIPRPSIATKSPATSPDKDRGFRPSFFPLALYTTPSLVVSELLSDFRKQQQRHKPQLRVSLPAGEAVKISRVNTIDSIRPRTSQAQQLSPPSSPPPSPPPHQRDLQSPSSLHLPSTQPHQASSPQQNQLRQQHEEESLQSPFPPPPQPPLPQEGEAAHQLAQHLPTSVEKINDQLAKFEQAANDRIRTAKSQIESLCETALKEAKQQQDEEITEALSKARQHADATLQDTLEKLKEETQAKIFAASTGALNEQQAQVDEAEEQQEEEKDKDVEVESSLAQLQQPQMTKEAHALTQPKEQVQQFPAMRSEDTHMLAFVPGMKLEAIDMKNPILVCVATVIAIDHSRADEPLLIGLDGWNHTYNYWASPRSQHIKPIGWCARNGVKLQPPFAFVTPSEFVWEAYLNDTRSRAVPSLLLTEHVGSDGTMCVEDEQAQAKAKAVAELVELSLHTAVAINNNATTIINNNNNNNNNTNNDTDTNSTTNSSLTNHNNSSNETEREDGVNDEDTDEEHRDLLVSDALQATLASAHELSLLVETVERDEVTRVSALSIDEMVKIAMDELTSMKTDMLKELATPTSIAPLPVHTFATPNTTSATANATPNTTSVPPNSTPSTLLLFTPPQRKNTEQDPAFQPPMHPSPPTMSTPTTTTTPTTPTPPTPTPTPTPAVLETKDHQTKHNTNDDDEKSNVVEINPSTASDTHNPTTIKDRHPVPTTSTPRNIAPQSIADLSTLPSPHLISHRPHNPVSEAMFDPHHTQDMPKHVKKPMRTRIQQPAEGQPRVHLLRRLSPPTHHHLRKKPVRSIGFSFG